jgi:hypothetical protein
MQQKLQFGHYPTDSQTINIRYGSFAYAQQYLRMNYWGNALTFNTNYDGSYTFMSNPIWTYDADATDYTTYVSGSGFLNAIYHIGVTRKGSGIVVRLVLPITLLILLASLTFWVDDVPSRVDSTVTLLLSVSALYIVILSNIPLLGYLTDIDKYVFAMFLLLVLVVGIHQTHATLERKMDQWPLRVVYIRMLDLFGRVALFPIVIGLYTSQIRDSVSETAKPLLLSVACSVSAVIFVREMFGVRKAFNLGLDELVKKVNNPETKLTQLSKFEVFVFNVWMLKTISWSPLHISSHLNHRGDFQKPDRQELGVRKLYSQQFAVNSGNMAGEPTIFPRKRADFRSEANNSEDRKEGSIFENSNPMFEMRSRSVKPDTGADSDDEDIEVNKK